jgi:class I fructose-bisphosphate aldolase
MGLGKSIRLARLFGADGGNLFGLAIDHFVGYDLAHHRGLDDLPGTLQRLLPTRPDSVTMQPGSALQCWEPHAGRAALMVQAGTFTEDDRISELLCTPEDALRLGADAIAVAILVNGPSEGRYLRWLSETVRRAAPLELPVVAHVYPRVFDADGPRIVTDPDGIAWAARCGIECGADVLKIAYTGDQESFASIVRRCPVPVVAAGGVRAERLERALEGTAAAMAAGARGAIVGRNIWGSEDPYAAALAYRAVVHEGLDARAALAAASNGRVPAPA